MRHAPRAARPTTSIHAVGELGVAEVAHAGLQQRAGQREVEGAQHGGVGVVAEGEREALG